MTTASSCGGLVVVVVNAIAINDRYCGVRVGVGVLLIVITTDTTEGMVW